jgi:hypothetical protein
MRLSASFVKWAEPGLFSKISDQAGERAPASTDAIAASHAAVWPH